MHAKVIVDRSRSTRIRKTERERESESRLQLTRRQCRLKHPSELDCKISHMDKDQSLLMKNGNYSWQTTSRWSIKQLVYHCGIQSCCCRRQLWGLVVPNDIVLQWRSDVSDLRSLLLQIIDKSDHCEKGKRCWGLCYDDLSSIMGRKWVRKSF